LKSEYDPGVTPQTVYFSFVEASGSHLEGVREASGRRLERPHQAGSWRLSWASGAPKGFLSKSMYCVYYMRVWLCIRLLRQSIKQAAGPHAAPLLTRMNFDGRSPQAGWPNIDQKRPTRPNACQKHLGTFLLLTN
jgi:hypothetical protein